ncbi:ABC transporter substrate-binding protein [Roseibium sp. HPY-6]|uniref:ABC transporter substrate-binding protein n=1 Tax=Roseibium sp. HPY-6 TaxID=3229852 RepID=UPI00338EF98B
MIARCILFVMILVFAGAAQAADFRVSFINPGGNDGFWGEVSRTMTAAADDLNIDLEILNADRQPYGMEMVLKQRLEKGDLPDYFILVNEYQSAARLLHLLDGTSSKVLFLLNTLTRTQRSLLEARGIDLRRVIASIAPDNENAGYEMALSLIEKRRGMRAGEKKIRLLALTGDTSTPSGLLRETGMQRAVAENPDVELLHAIPVDWNEEVAFARTKDVLARTQVDAIWGATDAIAFGARKAAVERGLTAGEDVLFAGLNWSKRAMEAIARREMTMSHGGDVFAGAWAIVLLRDHFFRTSKGEVYVDVRFKMSPITPANVDDYLEHLGDGNWRKIDFGRFCKTRTGRSNYDFSAAAILRAADAGDAKRSQ